MEDILQVIASFLDIKDVANYAQTCKSYYRTLTSNTVWQKLFLQSYEHLAENTLPAEFKDWYSYCRHINSQILRLYDRASFYEVAPWLKDRDGRYLKDEYYDEIDDWMQQVNTILPFVSDKLKRGDIVHFEQFGDYRNDGKYIYDGTKLLPLDTDYDDYGQLPLEFKVPTEFPPRYWSEYIDHNVFVPVDFERFRDEMIAHVVYRKNYWRTHFYCNFLRYNVWILWEEEKPANIEAVLENEWIGEYENCINELGGQANDIYITC